MKALRPWQGVVAGAVAMLLVALAFGKGLASARASAPAAASPCVQELVKVEVERQVQGVKGDLQQQVALEVRAEMGRMAAARRAKAATTPSTALSAAAAPATVSVAATRPASRPMAKAPLMKAPAAKGSPVKGPAAASQDPASRVTATVTVLGAVRAQLDRYALHHSGHFPTLAQLQDGWAVMVGRTDDWGRLGGRLGPYLNQTPRNAFTGSAKVAAFGKGSAEVGWVYDEKTHRLKAVVPAAVVGMFEEGMVEGMR